jgi:hypothetical protein
MDVELNRKKSKFERKAPDNDSRGLVLTAIAVMLYLDSDTVIADVL